jgi:hypothetical protein
MLVFIYLLVRDIELLKQSKRLEAPYPVIEVKEEAEFSSILAV